MLTRLLTTVVVLSSLVFGQQAPAAQKANIQQKLGYPANARLLVIHADDFGMDHSVNRAISQALENGWVTSASILVPCAWLPEVAHWAQSHQNADLGIHLALNSEWTEFRWGPVTPQDKVPSLVDNQGYLPLLEPDVVAHAKPAEVETELRSQIDRAKSMGIPLSHLDTHMGTLLGSQPLVDVYRKVAQDYHLPIPLNRAPENLRLDAPRPSETLVDAVLQIRPVVPADHWLQTYETSCSRLRPASMSSSSISHSTMTRCAAPPQTILVGELRGGSMTLTW